MAVLIRAGRVSDAAEVAGLTSQLGYDVSAATAAERLSRILSRRDQRFWVAVVDGRLVGWVHAARVEYLESGASVVIAGLVVDRGSRRQGLGTSLMKQAETWAASEGYRAIRLQSTISRTAAHRFYEARGYIKVKTQYSFVKPLGAAGADALRGFIPNVED